MSTVDIVIDRRVVRSFFFFFFFFFLISLFINIIKGRKYAILKQYNQIKLNLDGKNPVIC
jgi:hypothetical protein